MISNVIILALIAVTTLAYLVERVLRHQHSMRGKAKYIAALEKRVDTLEKQLDGFNAKQLKADINSLKLQSGLK